MTLDGRDREIVQLVARLRQLSSRQIFDLLFLDHSSHTPCDRALRRLTDRKYLARIERRIVGGSRGGSGQYVYQLGPKGWFTYYPDRNYNPSRAVNYHALAVGDCFVTLRQLDREGRVSILALSTEPDCWSEIGGVTLKPDLFLDVVTDGVGRGQLWIEIDMGTEAQRQLKGKLEAYWRGYQDTDRDVFPRVLWVAVDEPRAAELRWLIEHGPEDAQQLFQVTTAAGLKSLFYG